MATSNIISVPRGAVNPSSRWTSEGDVTVPLTPHTDANPTPEDEPLPFLCVSHDDMISNGFVSVDGYEGIYHRHDNVGGGVYAPFSDGLAPDGMGGVAFFGVGVDMRFGGMCALTIIAHLFTTTHAATADKGCALVVAPPLHFMYGSPGASRLQDIPPTVAVRTTEEVPDGVDGEGIPKTRTVVSTSYTKAPYPLPSDVDASFTIRNGGAGYALPVATYSGACCVRMYVPRECIDMRHTPDITGLVPRRLKPLTAAVYSTRYEFTPLVADPLVASTSRSLLKLTSFDLKGMLRNFDFAAELGIKPVLYQRTDLTAVQAAIDSLDDNYDLIVELSLEAPYDRINSSRPALATQAYPFLANEGSGQVAAGLGMLPPAEHRVPDLFSDAPLVNGYSMCGPPICVLDGYSFSLTHPANGARRVTDLEFANYCVSVDRVRAIFGLTPVISATTERTKERVSCFDLPLQTVSRETAMLREPLLILDPTADGGPAILDLYDEALVTNVGDGYNGMSDEDKITQKDALSSQNEQTRIILANAHAGAENQYYPGGHPGALLNQPVYVAFSRILSLVDDAVSKAGAV